MGKSMGEKAMMATLGVLALYAFAVVLWFVSAESAWKRAAKSYEDAKIKYEKEDKLIGEKRKWADEYENAKALMPTFEVSKATDTTWQRRLDELAEKHHVVISSSQPGREIEAGEVLVLPIDVKGWEGSLEALVRLMHELENTTNGMFDVTQLNFKPSSKKGYLRGNFTLNCAYMREEAD